MAFTALGVLPPGMNVVLQEGVRTGLIDAAGWVILLGGLAVTALWLKWLGR